MNDAPGSSAAEVARAYFDAQNRHDAEALMALFGEDGAFTDPNTGPISGEELRAFFAGAFEAVPDTSCEVDELFEGEGGRVAAQWRMRATNTGPLGDQPPSGNAVDVPGADIFVMEGGGIRSARAHFDFAAMARQLGGEE